MSSNGEQPVFLDPPTGAGTPEAARFHLLPVPYEATVSYGHGTALGPAAILAASAQVEFFDGVGVPADAGIWTAPALPVAGLAPEAAVDLVTTRVSAVLAAGQVPVLLGGEHTITLGAIRALQARGESFGVVQFDAHLDLRDTYTGTRFSHACVMRRITELGLPLFQLGVRCFSEGECAYRDQQGIERLDARALAYGPPPPEVLPATFPRRVYVTFDIDVFDPAVMPATGAPEPGGISWFMALDLLAAVIRGRTVLGYDVVELAPLPLLPGCDFLAARLVYAVMGLIQRVGAPASAPEAV